MSLKSVSNVFDASLSNEIEDALIEYFDWELLNSNNYFNVTKGELAPNGKDYSVLSLSSDPNYTKGKVWEGFRKNWVWQSGVSTQNPPIVGSNNAKPGISGIYINNAFYPTTTTGQYAYYIDYNDGKVIFNNPIPTGSKVQAEFSYKWINVIYPDDVPWLKEIEINTLEPKATTNIPEIKVQLPAVAIEVIPRRNFKPYQLGGGQWVYTDVVFHCIAEDRSTVKTLVDIFSLQNNLVIKLFDSNKISKSGDFPLDYRGVPNSGALRYPELVEKYPGGLLRLTNTAPQNYVAVNSNIYGAAVRSTTELIKLDI